MPHILCIETSTTACSVSVSYEGKIIYKEEEPEGPSHASLLGVFVENAIRYVQAQKLQLDAVAVSSGPGSYTGLRIGVSEAKGLCYGLDIPLIAVNTLLLMASKVKARYSFSGNTLFCPMIDARRMEVYSALYNQNLEIVREIKAEIIEEDSYQEYLRDNEVIFFGNGSGKCRETITGSNAIFLPGIYPLAEDMVLWAEKAFRQRDFVDVAYFEPFYLKEFIATVPKNKIM